MSETKTPYTIDTLLSKIVVDGQTQHDVEKIKDAYELASSAHGDQKRSSGEAYITHPLAVACILSDFNMDTDTIVAAILHDVVEDTETTIEQVKKRFGADVAVLVDGVTKMSKLPLNTKEEENAENIRKILLAMSKDIRVILIKLADRLHNMRTLEYRPPEKQKAAALMTMSFFAPIAHRLGMNSVKEEMEDLSIRYLDPYGFNELCENIKSRSDERESFINNIKERVMERISNIEPTPIIEGRIKGFYSIYKKVYNDGKNFDEVYDIYAVRIIVHSVTECYNVLGVIHDMFRPIPFRFKDYIATPKPNRYQSLHTTVIGKEGVPFEVQIRTVDMHNTAEFGVAAHWKYKEGIMGKSKPAENAKLEWVRHLLEQQQEADDIHHLADAIKTDLAPDDVYVFTPKGDIVTLPLGSTVIDFAYAIHSQVGNKMTGAKVGGRMASFDYKLETGDIVDIMVTNNPSYGPNRNWLDIVRTNQAKVKIRAWFRRERRSENIAEGKAALEKELKRNSIPIDADLPELLKVAASELRYDDVDDFFAAIGYGGVQVARAVQKVKEIYVSKHSNKNAADVLDVINVADNIAKKQSKGVVVEGIDNCLVKFANCCAPLPGDDIIGFITRGYGVSVHKSDCVYVDKEKISEEQQGRLIGVSWAHHGGLYYRAAIEIIAEDRGSLILDVTTVISENRLSISGFVGKKLKNGNACIDIALEIASVEQLNGLLNKLKKVPGVIMATRKET